MTNRPIRRWWWIVILIGVLSMTDAADAQDWRPRQLNVDIFGAGASFPAPPINAWSNAYASLAPDVNISYNPSSSLSGQDDFVNRRVDFGVSDVTLSSELIRSVNFEALKIPVGLSGAAIYYNLSDSSGKQINGLRFSDETLAGIYLGEITKWNDGRIQNDNPGVSLPNTTVTPIHHKGNAGINALFTEYLSSVSSEWESRVGTSSSPSWIKSGDSFRAEGNGAVASKIRNTKGAIGFLDVGYALENNLAMAPIKNRGGTYILPNEESLRAAAGARPLVDNFAANLIDPNNSAAYPIAGYMYVMVRKTSSDANYVNKAKAQADFLYWCLTQGSQQLRSEGFFPLNGDGRTAAIEALRSIRVNGEQIFQ
jgi:phosphate transport system substrate-binding protein